MGQTYACDGCENEPAIMSLNNMETGDTQFVGVQCLPTWLRATADAVEAATVTPDAPIDLMPTDSASPQYDPTTGDLLEEPARPEPAPPQPTVDPDAGGTGAGTTDHGTETEPAPVEPSPVPGTPDNPVEPVPGDGEESGSQTVPVGEPGNAEPVETPSLVSA